MSNENLANWTFAYNATKNEWWATRNEFGKSAFNNNQESILKADSFETLRELIIKTNGDKEKLNKLVNGG